MITIATALITPKITIPLLATFSITSKPIPNTIQTIAPTPLSTLAHLSFALTPHRPSPTTQIAISIRITYPTTPLDTHPSNKPTSITIAILQTIPQTLKTSNPEAMRITKITPQLALLHALSKSPLKKSLMIQLLNTVFLVANNDRNSYNS